MILRHRDARLPGPPRAVPYSPGIALQRIAMWAAGVVLALSALGLWVSRSETRWDPDDPGAGSVGVGVVRGSLDVHNWMPLDTGSSAGQLCCVHRYPRNWWWPDQSGFVLSHQTSQGIRWSVMIPLWIPTTGAAIVLVAGFSFGRRARARARVRRGLCPACGYDLTGIHGVCPECGRSDCRGRSRIATSAC